MCAPCVRVTAVEARILLGNLAASEGLGQGYQWAFKVHYEVCPASWMEKKTSLSSVAKSPVLFLSGSSSAGQVLTAQKWKQVSH